MRLQADYTGAEIDAKSAVDAVAQAEEFVQTVERLFSLGSYPQPKFQKDDSDHGEKISEGNLALIIEGDKTDELARSPLSLEEERRHARENWLRLRQQKIGAGKDIEKDRNTRRDTTPGQGHLLDNDSDE